MKSSGGQLVESELEVGLNVELKTGVDGLLCHKDCPERSMGTEIWSL